MDYKFLKFKIDDRGVAFISLNRPELHNAFNDELIREMTHLFFELNKNESARLAVLTGEGKSFCAGADLNWMKSMANYSKSENIEDARNLSNLFQTIDDLNIPLIGKINGHALGGGVGVVSVCDYAITSSQAKFGFTEVRLGLIPAVISPYCIRKIGESNARAWFLSGERFDAKKAFEMNLVHEVCEESSLDERVEALIESFLKAGPQASREAKKLIRNVMTLDKDVKEYTYEAIAKQRVSLEGQEGMGALLEKRAPSWM